MLPEKHNEGEELPGPAQSYMGPKEEFDFGAQLKPTTSLSHLLII